MSHTTAAAAASSTASQLLSPPSRSTLRSDACLMIASLGYLDKFARMDGAWLFAERQLYVDWLEEGSLS
jgi:hypothetical protein